jgi:protein-tyrosine phosphatase
MAVHLKVDGVHNIRDLGAYPLAAGGSTHEKVLIRASGLDQVPAAAQQQIIDYGVQTIIDLRDEWEAERFPNVFAQSSAVQYVNLPLIGNQLSQAEGWDTDNERFSHLHQFYWKLLDQCQAQIGAIIAAIAASPPATIFHCYAGKDRTGMIAALILGVVGVPDEIIAEDYAASSEPLSVLKAQWRSDAQHKGSDMALLERDIASEAITMRNTLDYIRQHYGGIAAYLRRCGVSDAQLDQLNSALHS